MLLDPRAQVRERALVGLDAAQLQQERVGTEVAADLVAERAVRVQEDERGRALHLEALAQRPGLLGVRIDREAQDVLELGQDARVVVGALLELLAVGVRAREEVEEDDALLGLGLRE
jgi:hypothetical protein